MMSWKLFAWTPTDLDTKTCIVRHALSTRGRKPVTVRPIELSNTFTKTRMGTTPTHERPSTPTPQRVAPHLLGRTWLSHQLVPAQPAVVDQLHVLVRDRSDCRHHVV